MEISENELRTMIREAIARQSGGGTPGALQGASSFEPVPVSRAHASHAIFAGVPSGDGECIIEPSVRCNHCGYCKSLGH